MKIFRCTPDHFDVLYRINPHMKIGSVNVQAARDQWNALGEVYKNIGIETEVIEGVRGLPDMVFSANQSLPFGKKGVIMSNMMSEHREPEVGFFSKWYEAHGYEVHYLSEGVKLEGMGDMIYHSDRSFLWGGHGFRTELNAHREIEKISGIEVRSLKLIDSAFYHLDVCLCVLNEKTVLVYKEAFDEESFSKLEEVYEDLIEVTREEAYNFACNAHCPDGKNVIFEKGSKRLQRSLRERNFEPIPVDTSEFIKAGGSVYCLKLDLQ